MKELVRLLYKTLLQTSKRLDANPAVKALISQESAPESPLVRRYIDEFLRGRQYYLPSALFPGVRIRDVIRGNFRNVPEGASLDEALDAGFEAHRFMSSVLASGRRAGLAGISTVPGPGPAGASEEAAGGGGGAAAAQPSSKKASPNPIARRGAGRLAGHAKLLGNPEPGALLLAHPSMSGEFERTVVLLCHYSDSQGAYGLVINRPTPIRGSHLSLFVSAGAEAVKAQQQQQSSMREAAQAEAAGPAPLPEGQEGAAAESAGAGSAQAEAGPGPQSPGKAAAEKVLEASESDGPQNIGAIWGRGAALRQQQEEEARGRRGEEGGAASGAGPGPEDGLGSFYLNMPLELLKLCGDAQVYHGGPVPGLQVIHRCPGVPKSIPLNEPSWAEPASPAGGRGRAAAPSGQETPSAGSAAAGGSSSGQNESGSGPSERPPEQLFVGGDLETALEKGMMTPGDVRLFLGEAGWSPGQLEGEILQGAWVVARAPLSRLDLFRLGPVGGKRARRSRRKAAKGASEGTAAAAGGQAEAAAGGSEAGQGQGPAAPGSQQPLDLWSEVMMGLGGLHRAMSVLPQPSILRSQEGERENGG